MKKILCLLFLLSFNCFAVEKTYKIQVFRIVDNKMLFGLHADDLNYNDRLKWAKTFHKVGETTLINVEITAELEAAKQKVIDRKNLIKDKNANTKDRLDAVIEYLRLDI